MKVCHWENFKCLDAGNGEKLESWNGVVLRRPDPQASWNVNKKNKLWETASGIYHRNDTVEGEWEFKEKLPEFWNITYKDLVFKVSPTSFKHTGLFPEQAVNWDYMIDKIKHSGKKIKVLNLFAYTGAATMACSLAGAEEVVHVDSSKGMVSWAKENMSLCNLENNHIRFIVDDCLKFVEREIRRERKYDAIVMDPPSYGRGPTGEMWKFENDIANLIRKCTKLLSDEPLFFIVNSYTTGVGLTEMEKLLKTSILKEFPNGVVSVDEIGIPIENSSLVLPCGVYGRWESIN